MPMGGSGPLRWPPRPSVPWVSWTDRESTQDHMVWLLRESKHSWNQWCYLPGLQVTLGNKTGDWASAGQEKDENKWTDSSVQLSQLGKWNGWGHNFALCLSGSHSELIYSLLVSVRCVRHNFRPFTKLSADIFKRAQPLWNNFNCISGMIF